MARSWVLGCGPLPRMRATASPHNRHAVRLCNPQRWTTSTSGSSTRSSETEGRRSRVSAPRWASARTARPTASAGCERAGSSPASPRPSTWAASAAASTRSSTSACSPATQPDTFEALRAALPAVREVAFVTGRFDYHVRVACRDADDLDATVARDPRRGGGRADRDADRPAGRRLAEGGGLGSGDEHHRARRPRPAGRQPAASRPQPRARARPRHRGRGARRRPLGRPRRQGVAPTRPPSTRCASCWAPCAWTASSSSARARRTRRRCSTTASSIGDGSPPQVDIAVDPLEGTTLRAKGMPSALAVIALAERGIDVRPRPVRLHGEARRRPTTSPTCSTSTGRSSETLALVAERRGVEIGDVMVVVLDRPRHEEAHRGDPRRGRARAAHHRRRRRRRRCWRSPTARPSTCCGASAARPEGVISAAAIKCIGRRARRPAVAARRRRAPGRARRRLRPRPPAHAGRPRRAPTTASSPPPA